MPDSPTRGARRPAATRALGAFIICLALPLFAAAQAPHAAAQAPHAAAQAPHAAAQTPPAKASDLFPMAPVWTITLDAAPADALAYDADHAFIALKARTDEGQAQPARVVALSLSDGSTRWSRDVDDVHALVAGDNLLVACSGTRLLAFDAVEGRPLWQLPLDAPLAAPLHYDGGWLVAVTQASQALAIRARDGQKVWQVRLPSPATGEPALSGDGLYLPLTDNRVVRLNLQTGTGAWDRKILSQPMTILLSGDRVFVGTRERWFYALEPDSGRVQWRVRVGAGIAGTPAADAASVVFLSLDNLLRALDRSGGSLKWRQLLTRRGRFGPFPVGQALFVSGASPTIQAYSRVGGAPAGSFDAPHDLDKPVHVVGGLTDRDFLLIAVTVEREVIAIRPHTLEPEAFAISPLAAFAAGQPRWRW
jgi:outer membrane protein assembly factor BamB